MSCPLNGHPHPVKISVCGYEETIVCVCVFKYVCVREKGIGNQCFLGQAVRQQGGIITEAVTFLWFL